MYQSHVIIDLEFNPTKQSAGTALRQEIIEIGAIKLNADYEEIGRFSCFVRPQFNDHVLDKITRLTGIRSCDVMNAISFEAALGALSQWIGEDSTRLYSWSDSDCDQLWKECAEKGLNIPDNMTRWMDFQMVWQYLIRYPRRQCMALKYAVEQAGIVYDKSKAHRASYDCEITAELLRLTRSPEYLSNLAKARQIVTDRTEHSTYRIDSACGGKLAELLQQLAAAS